MAKTTTPEHLMNHVPVCVLRAALLLQGKTLPGGEWLSITSGSVEGLSCPQPPTCHSDCSQKRSGEGGGRGAMALTHL